MKFTCLSWVRIESAKITHRWIETLGEPFAIREGTFHDWTDRTFGRPRWLSHIWMIWTRRHLTFIHETHVTTTLIPPTSRTERGPPRQSQAELRTTSEATDNSSNVADQTTTLQTRLETLEVRKRDSTCLPRENYFTSVFVWDMELCNVRVDCFRY